MLVVLVHHISLIHYCTILFLHSQNCVSSHWVMNKRPMNTLCHICAQCQTRSTAASFRLALSRLVATVFICNHSTMIPCLREWTRCFALLEELRRVRRSGRCTHTLTYDQLPPPPSHSVLVKILVSFNFIRNNGHCSGMEILISSCVQPVWDAILETKSFLRSVRLTATKWYPAWCVDNAYKKVIRNFALEA
jgi:hypothetical protein